MQSLNVLRHLARSGHSLVPFLILSLTLLLVECGLPDTNTYNGPPPCSPYGDYGFSIDFASVNSSGIYAYLRGTAFSEPPVSGNCPVGPDTSMTVNWTNQSSGASGAGRLWYAWSVPGFIPISQCTHYWEAGAPVIAGNNVIAITISGNTHSCTQTTKLQGQLVVMSMLPGSSFNYNPAVPVNTTITAVFNGQIDPQTITPSSFSLSSPYGSQTGSFMVSGSTVTFTPDKNLYGNTAYTIYLTPDVKDINGNVLSVSSTWSFITGSASAVGDTTPPVISSTMPVNNATGVAVNGQIIAYFGEPMTLSTINTATFSLNNGVTGTVSYYSTPDSIANAVFTPSIPLAYNTTYTATITTGVQDAVGNAMTSPYSWTFTTGTAPPPPTVLSVFPANGATGVAVNTRVTATFSQEMMTSTINSASFYLDNGITNYWWGGGFYNPGEYTAILTPQKYLAYSTTYTATITTSVMNYGGVAMAALYSWSFTTGPVGSMFIVPDTGQTLCYTSSGSLTPCAGTGQDGAFTINPPSYTDNGDGTITDNVTGLVWQKQDDGNTRDWTNANSYCNSLTLGGQTGWRLPSLMELISIVDYGVYSPPINPTYFPGTGIYYYWTSTPYTSDPSLTWSVYFAWGSTDHSYNNGTSNWHYVRCVRGGQATQRLTDNANGTVTDNNTLLTWQQGESSTMNWQSALSYCEYLTLAPQTASGWPWRLPNSKELVSLADYGRQGPAINTVMFRNARSSPYWSATSTMVGALAVDFFDGSMLVPPQTFGAQVRCVRGGQ